MFLKLEYSTGHFFSPSLQVHPQLDPSAGGGGGGGLAGVAMASQVQIKTGCFILLKNYSLTEKSKLVYESILTDRRK